MYCLFACLLTFWKGIWSQHALRFSASFRSRAIEEIRDNFFIRILDTNIEFCSKANAAFISKMMLYETNPISTFYSVMVDGTAALVSIVYAVVIVYLTIHTNPWAYSILLYALLMVLVIAFMHRWLVKLKKKYRSLSSRCAGYLEELIAKMRIVRVNSLQNFLMRRVWLERKKQSQVVKYLNVFESIFDLIFSSPLMASPLVLMWIQKSYYGNSANSTVLFTIIGVFSSLKGIMESLSSALSSYQDFVPSRALFHLFFNKVSRVPKIGLLKIDPQVLTKMEPRDNVILQDRSNPSHSKSSAKHEMHYRKPPSIFVQYSRNIDRRTIASSILKQKQDFAVLFEDCCFVDKSNTMSEILKTVFMEDYLGTATRIDKNRIQNPVMLENLNLKILPGQKVCVMGLERSGAQFFLDCLSNEHELVEGRLSIRGKLSHFDLNRVEMLDETFLENIILDSKLHRRRFEKVCSVVNLDLASLVGREMGNMSKNQAITFMELVKIVLARSFYQSFDIFVISNVFTRLNLTDKLDFFDNIVRQYLKFNTVVYHSNDPLVARKSDIVLVFSDQKLVEVGNFTDLCQNKYSHVWKIGHALQNVQELQVEIFNTSYDRRRAKRRNAIKLLDAKTMNWVSSLNHDTIRQRISGVVSLIVHFNRMIKAKVKGRRAKKLTYDAGMLLSTSTYSSLTKLLRIDGDRAITVIVAFFLFNVLLLTFYDIWVGWWSVDFFRLSTADLYFEFLIYLSLFHMAFILFRDTIYNKIVRSISNNIFFANVKKIMKASVQWFDLFGIPMIIYDMNNYQNSMDDDFNKMISTAINDILMALFSLIISNIFYPGFFMIITIVVFLYARSIMRRFIRANRIWLVGYLKSRVDWFGSYVNALKNAVAMRNIGKNRYMYKRFYQAAMLGEQTGTHIWAYAARWLGIRVSGISAFLAFWVYFIPVILIYIPIWNFKDNIWLLGFVLTWSGRASTAINDFMDNLLSMMTVAEGGERLLELQLNYPKSLEALNSQPTSSLDAVHGDELDETELEKIFMNRQESDQIKFHFEPHKPILEIEDLSFHVKQKYFLKNVSLTVNCGENVVFVQDHAESVQTLLDIVMGLKTLDTWGDIKYRSASCKSFKLFGKDIASLSPYALRRGQMYIVQDPPIFTGSLRDNIDPFRLFSDEDIVRTLHYFGFYTCYKIYIRAQKDAEVQHFLENQTRFAHKPTWKKKCCSWRTKEPILGFKKVNLKLKDIRKVEDHKTSTKNLSSEESKDRRAFIRLKVVVKIIIVLRNLLQSSKSRRKDFNADVSLGEELVHGGFLTEEEKYFYTKGNKTLKRASSRLMHSSVVKYDINTLLKNNLMTHTIEDPQERKILSQIISSMLSNEGKRLSQQMRRIMWLTRAVLEKPDILVLDEDALILEQPFDPEYIQSCFSMWSKTTVLCRASSYKTIDRYQKVAYFKEGALVEFGDTGPLLNDNSSMLHKRLMEIDPRIFGSQIPPKKERQASAETLQNRRDTFIA